MVSQLHQGTGERLCSLVARRSGEDPIGTATSYDAYLFVEVPLAWPHEAFDAKSVAPGLVEALNEAQEAQPGLRMQAIVPWPEADPAEGIRLLYYRRPPEESLADMERREYIVAPGRAAEVVRALVRGQAVDESVARAVTAAPDVRDLFVCTHGSRDVCCGQFGYPVFEKLREHYVPQSDGRLRVWRVSHLGGHRFAPTLLEMPSARYWAFVDPEILDTLILRKGAAASLREHYRGWGALRKPMEQVAEREAFCRFGWAWLSAEKRVETVSEDAAAGQAVVRIAYRPAGAGEELWEAVVERAGTVRTLINSNSDEWKDVPQYRVVRFERVDG